MTVATAVPPVEFPRDPAAAVDDVQRVESAPRRKTRVRKITGDIVMLTFTAFAISSLLGAIGDPVEVFHKIRHANGWWVLLAATCSLLTNVTDARTALGSIPAQIPLISLIRLQVAGYFTGIATPGSIGTIATTTSFFKKHGLPGATAVTSSVLISVAGMVAQVALFLTCIALGRSAFELSDFGGGGGGDAIGRWILVGVIVVGVAVTVVMRVPKVREKVLRPLRQAYESLRSVLHSPRRMLWMVAGNLGTQLLFACCLGASLRAFGYSLPLTTLVIVNTAASLLAGVSPVPGGLGAAEAALVAGLTTAGVPSAVAVPAALTHRLVTSWMTPVLGWFALRNLKHRGEV